MENIITNKEFIKELADESGLTQKVCKQVVGAVSEVAKKYMADGATIKAFPGIVFMGVNIPERTAVNPQTGDKITVAPHIQAKCKFTQGFKAAIR